MHPGLYRRCPLGRVLQMRSTASVPDNILDHDERIPLFTRTFETDPELPYGALLR